MTSDKMEIDSHNEVNNVGDVKGAVKYAEEETMEEIIDTLKVIAKTTATLDPRYVWRALKEVSHIRKNHLKQETLTVLVTVLYPESSEYKKSLLKYINDKHKSVVTHEEEIRAKYPATFYEITPDGRSLPVSAEINSFVHLLVQLYLLDSGKIQELNDFNTKVVVPRLLSFYNHRSLDLINAKLWFYIVMARERLENRQDNALLRNEMTKFLKTASLKHDNETRAMLISLILRNFLASGEVEAASDFVNKVDPLTPDVSSPLEARFFFYLSKINAIQLDYSTANEYIIAAIRKAPHTKNSLGFLQQANKLSCVIQLLMGDIPELSFFHQEGMEHSLIPYYHISKAVKLGDLKKFTSTITKYKQQLINDDNYQICVRLRSNVIKTGIRIISLTYKKISLKDICMKLHLESEQTAEYMVSRAIRDGVIEAKVNHEEGYIETSEVNNTYDTKDPQNVFDERIRFVNKLHDESVVAMRYPEDKKKGSKKNDEDEFMEGELLDDLSDFSDIDDLGFL
ncbi:26S proteasome regulatory subunit RPN3 [Nakaseomyces bracarensis]|uniref:26S proteasome regulatory subunit RPN3 n=1 Tax=Nakaseomyces bracarensis TaxID=273131 RepID=A0ABR4NP43_9SACH